ncbi:hypothetical protein WK22_04000 [Burkholderia multivorans]|nr:hypothetical protein WK22_04000 [Burkholderia multivorans]
MLPALSRTSCVARGTLHARMHATTIGAGAHRTRSGAPHDIASTHGRAFFPTLHGMRGVRPRLFV